MAIMDEISVFGVSKMAIVAMETEIMFKKRIMLKSKRNFTDILADIYMTSNPRE